MIAAVLTKESAEKMSVVALVQACADQIDATHPGLNDDAHKEASLRLFERLASEAHKHELALVGAAEMLNEVHTENIDTTAANLLDPELRDGEPQGHLSVTGADGEEWIVGLVGAKTDDFERPYHPRHRLAYKRVLDLLRSAGHETYLEAFEAGVFADEPDAS